MNKGIRELARIAYTKQIPATTAYAEVTVDSVNDTIRGMFKELMPEGKDRYRSFRKNKIEIFELMEEAADEVVPKKVREKIAIFADVQEYAQGKKPVFKMPLGKANIKRFLTKIGLGGVYERVRLDRGSFDVICSALGGTVYTEFEQFLDGTMDFAELCDLFIEALEEATYKEVYKALTAHVAKMPATNKKAFNGFDVATMNKLITVAKAYGTGVNIICTPEFASKITPSAGFISDVDKNDIRERGYIGKFYGASVIVLDNSYEDNTNEITVFNPRYAFVIPTGGNANEKVVKVAYEGGTIIKETENADDSMEFKVQRKMGVAVTATNHICVFEDESFPA